MLYIHSRAGNIGSVLHVLRPADASMALFTDVCIQARAVSEKSSKSLEHSPIPKRPFRAEVG